ncbi:fructosamine kinase family protein [Natronogracilivirga saccharolytica]|uniref:Fructosamine kinase family protein n=1 Tax=Natronogracilivirga saccharolytica TaxID=2812953 RepID=A0A8J7S6A6_9BACT|nr:fructosamine kinase family protein [Natronogracilivirga saccharolytica]MBP3192748.1 fructosamine kinase family protein [Natronogracilivirga saccharolytica]
MKIAQTVDHYFNEQFGSGVSGVAAVGGGCINDTYRVTLGDGSDFFVKENRISLLDMFEKEARGLRLLSEAANGIQIPEVHGILKDEESGQAWLVLSFIREASKSSIFDDNFGRALAGMHQNSSSQYGLDHNNYIGRLPQINDWRDDWVSFFIDCRIEPQVKMAREKGHFSGQTGNCLERLYKMLPDIMPEAPPSLLHGDLWGGNYLCDDQDRPVLIDPAVYYGHPEAELAFTRLFGGFGPDFYKSYEEVSPLSPGFSERVDIYNLYPLLVHVNLFGGSYVSQTEAIIRRF